MKRIGIIGYGFIGSAVFEAIAGEAHPGLTVAFVWNRSRDRLSGVPPALVLDDLADAPTRGADLVVEAAHPEVTRAHGAAVGDGARR
jgi:predicted dinucleotide-utilizing enzyme